ncbi:PREDICTED: uncharacterized protein LOC104813758 isoform X2 [Tarenaya hassleriana]|uniref:uncharacterized protein LOC104813758 isoform X1 n=1 Tax=Tarenaya hassleriana TaxID=28532 RepID=UPI00053C79AD|nr:PREDICTED: uncharacterized protein LOC104813758 isoform X1 [Tarenaya hassleriana]XP_010539804.1 PREDICTED: uncharacterized protein LOC104813758 isoform X2 [Tarenaya hassleriana]
MVGVFRRSLSFPNKPNTGRPFPPPSKPRISHHTRSISLPCRSHPLISHINHEISQLKSWSSFSAGFSCTSAWISDGLSLLKDVHETLSDILHLPQSQESLRKRPIFFENLLEDLLRFVDAYGIFQTSILSLREHNSAAQVALRKRDDAKISYYLKSRQNIARDIARLTSSIREPKTKQEYCCHVGGVGSYADAELASAIGDVIEVTVSVSVALFDGVYFPLRQARTTPFVGFLKRSEKKERKDEGIEEMKKVDEKSLVGLRKKKDEEVKNLMKRMAELENSMCEIECGSEKVFRSLINTRVSLLNALTH